jgi:hypothetical protein
MKNSFNVIRLVVAGLLIPPATLSAQMLETETARLIPRGVVETGAAFEYQTSSTGKEMAVPTLLGFGLTDKFELMLEPVLYTSIRPNTGAKATGVGDLEATVTFRFSEERMNRPAFAFAAEAKAPTAHNKQIGTGKADFTGYLIASKRLGAVDTHANIGYTIVGSPVGAHLRNTWNAALAAVIQMKPHTGFFAEVLGVTAAAPDGENGDLILTSPIPEAAGAELVGTIGISHTFGRSALIYGGWSYDNNSASQLRMGMTLSTPRIR